MGNQTVFRRLLAAPTSVGVLQAGVELARSQLSAEISWCGVALNDELRLVAHTGVHGRRMVDDWSVPLGRGVGGRAALGEEVVYVRDYRKDPRRIAGVKSLIDHEGVRSAIVAPLRAAATPAAALYVGSRSTRRFNADEASSLMKLCGDISQVWSIRVESERLAERLSVARDRVHLHDMQQRLEDSILAALHERGDLTECLHLLATHFNSSVEFVYRSPGPTLRSGNIYGPVQLEVPVVGVDSVLGDLIIRRPTELADAEHQSARRISRILAIFVDGRRAATRVEHRLTTGFLQRLVDGGLGDEDDLRCQAALLGFDFSAPHVLCAIGIRSTRDSGDLRPMHRRMVETIENAFLRSCPGAVVFPEAQHVAVALPIGLDGIPPGRIVENTIVELGHHLEAHQQLVAGIGGVCSSLNDYADSHYEARLALRVAHRRGATRVCSIANLDVHDVVSNTEQSSLLMRVTGAQLAPLLKLREEGDESLLATLAEFFRCGGSVSHTAERLLVHANTVRYRLGRISELLAVDLGDADARFALEMAVRLQQG